MRVLIVEDDVMIGRALSQSLKDNAMAVDWVRDGIDAEFALQTQDHSLVLLDLSLPGKDGIEILRSVRTSGRRVPILIVTARDDIDDRIKGLDLGADDYLIKPFDIGELLARMRALVRRRHGGQAVSSLVCGKVKIDLDTHVVAYGGTSHLLPAREFALLRALCERPGAVLSRAQLEESLYGWGEEVQSNAIDVLIHYVRRKFSPTIIRNVRGVGWTIDKDGR